MFASPGNLVAILHAEEEFQELCSCFLITSDIVVDVCQTETILFLSRFERYLVVLLKVREIRFFIRITWVWSSTGRI